MTDIEKLDQVHQAREFTHRVGVPNRKAILEGNQRMRDGRDPGPRNFGGSGGFGRVALRIPEFDYPFIKAMFPDIGSPDGTVKAKGWEAFMRSPLSEPYKVDRKLRSGGKCL